MFFWMFPSFFSRLSSSGQFGVLSPFIELSNTLKIILPDTTEVTLIVISGVVIVAAAAMESPRIGPGDSLW